MLKLASSLEEDSCVLSRCLAWSFTAGGLPSPQPVEVDPQNLPQSVSLGVRSVSPSVHSGGGTSWRHFFTYAELPPTTQ